ncbi:Alpha/Beta hydrolase protein [Armillaria borealis]|uniref:Alpha/Beta hydrolase protein n=1 Tax=Armillaria borealis TaxID=47425 RepID=A0AA39JED1_9AGAR|nr:Alpha/Beta hydrolase protein [Armillaria borealis]
MLFPALLIILASVLQLCSAQSTPVVDLGYAKYRGTFDTAGSNNTQFLGIRFAAPPIGSLRWQAPRTPDFVAGIQNATAEPPGCLQAGTGAAPSNSFPANKRDTLAMSNPEDCLFLNVYTPGQLDSHSPSKSLPVVVWIHGGGYVAGSASTFDGNDLIRESGNGVVAVIIQYRLGLFGFLAGEVVKANGRLNAGLLDQQFALQWVQEHIAKFGGDPGRVTIWGESAGESSMSCPVRILLCVGAGSVLQQVIANDGKTFPPLFRAAITSSSFLPSQYAFNDVVPEFLYNSVVSSTNCTSAANSLACLRNADVNVLEQININLCGSGFFGTFVFVPVVDGDFITQRPALALLEGKVNGEALMSITNANEGSLFVNASTASTVQVPEYLTQLFPSLSAQHLDVAVAKYSGLGAPIDQVTAIMGESIFVCPTYFLLRAFQGRATFKASWKGQFAIPPATHGMDVAFYFTANASGVPAFNNADFDEAFADSFLAFVVSLDPNHTFEPTITPDWKPFSFQQGHQVEMRFNRTESGDPAVSPFTTPEDLLDRCSLTSSPSTPVIDLGYARYRGTLDPAGSNNTQFLGIRFAAPPTGSLRWQAPRTPGFVAGIQNATAEPPRCLQGGTGAASSNSFPANKRDNLAVPNSEDCLFLKWVTDVSSSFLSVYIPGQLDSRSSGKTLPVVVWIHGGGANGFSGPDAYDGNDLVRESGDGVIAVVIQYRLGLFGFLAGEEVKANGRLNAGLLDQQFALQWVQEHIAKFGGDPGRVTIWGESAGAGSVLQQVIANDGKTFPPLFRAAITSSSFLPSQYAFNDVVPEFLYNSVVSGTNCTSAANTLACLRNADVNVLEQININLCGSGFFGTFVFVPVVDGDFIKQRPALALLEGKVNGEALMSITNADEGAIFVDSSTAGTVQVPEYLMQLFPSLSAQHRDVAVAKYSGLGAPIDQVTAIMGESIFVCPTYFLLRAFQGRATFKANNDIKFNQGQFAIPPATHGMDVSFYFPSMNANGVPSFSNADFDKAFAESFLAFAIYLDPNQTFEPTITPDWKPFSFQQGHQVEMRFNRTESGDPAVSPFTTPEDLLDRCS